MSSSHKYGKHMTCIYTHTKIPKSVYALADTMLDTQVFCFLLFDHHIYQVLFTDPCKHNEICKYASVKGI